jgi:hypothetical protein
VGGKPLKILVQVCRYVMNAVGNTAGSSDEHCSAELQIVTWEIAHVRKQKTTDVTRNLI